MNGGGGATWPEAIAGALVRFGVGLRRFVARVLFVGHRRIVTVVLGGLRCLSGSADFGMPGHAVMLTVAHGGGLQTLRDHEARDQQKPGHRRNAAPSIVPDHHVPILEPAYRFSNPAMAGEPVRRQFGREGIRFAPRV